MVKLIIASLEKECSMSRALKRELRNLLEIKTCRKGHFFLKPGQTCGRVYFIIKGVVRGYTIDEKGKECTVWIVKEGDVFISLFSFISQTPGEEYIEALEETTVGSISHEELQMIYTKYSNFNIIGRKLFEHYYILREEHAKMLTRCNALERYAFFQERHGDIESRITASVVASYLGLDQATLSKKKTQYHRTKKPNNDVQ
jgi:CRP-like cAMP-binding protein